MKKLCGKFYISVIFLLGLCSLLYAGTHAFAATLSPPAQADNRDNFNGITVDRPKVFDNRTLTLMLENLNESLRKIQVVDQQSLAAAFNLLQGFQTREVARSLSINGRPTPKITEMQKANTGNATEDGTLLPNSTETSTQTERASETPTQPSLGTLPTFSGFTPSYGENPSDLLSDQINLTYQIFNLRMLLERSLSDRLLSDNNPRRQAVLGFNVTVDPPRTAEDAVAVVEVTLNLAKANGEDRVSENSDGLSLVSMMPEEKTYNAAALSTKSNAFGGAAIAKMIHVGYSEQRRGQTFYLYRDADTIAYQRMNNGNSNQIILGWMFRPVLGRRSVSPGLRQLFAIVALPKNDKQVSEADAQCEFLNASVRTYWKKYDHDTKTSFDAKDANRATKVRYALSLNLSKPEIFNKNRYEKKAVYKAIEVKPTTRYETGLLPKVNSVSWRSIGAKSIIISATGENFFSETKVAMGDKIYSTPADGLILKSNQAFDLTTTSDALASGAVTIIGRYGSSIPLIAKETRNNPGKPELIGAEMSLSRSGFSHVIFTFSDQEDPSKPKLLSKEYLMRTYNLSEPPSPIITANGKVVPFPYEFAETIDPDSRKHILVIQCDVPDSYLNANGTMLKLFYPFLPDTFTFTWLVTYPEKDFEVSRFSKQGILIYSRTFYGFKDPRGKATTYCWKLFAGGKLYELNSEQCVGDKTVSQKLAFNAVSVDLSNLKPPVDIPDKITLIAPNNDVLNLDVIKSAPSETAAPKPIEVGLNDRVIIEIPVDNAALVDRVIADGEGLDIIPFKAPDGNEPLKKLKVRLTTKITGKAGKVDLSVFTKQDPKQEPKDVPQIPKIVTIEVVCKTCRNKGEK